MSIDFKPCPHCNEGVAEALYIINDKAEWFCSNCNASGPGTYITPSSYHTREELQRLYFYGED